MKINLLSSFLLAFGINSAIANEIVPPPCPTIQMSGSSVSCYGGSDGAASVTIISGGSGNYSYTWSVSPGNTNSINGLSAGTYTVNVKDNVSGCTVIGAYVVGSPDAISVSGTVTDVNCKNASTGAIDISVSGGSGSYTYDWNNIATGPEPQDNIGIPDGTYQVIVTDNNGCKDTSSYVISEPAAALGASGVTSNISCSSGSDGEITITTWGGTPSYAFDWDNIPGSPDPQSQTGLTAGTYNLTVTDSKGCTYGLSFNLTQPNILGGTISQTDVLCYGDATGTVSFSALGGTMPYSYSWQNSTTLFAQNSSGLTNVVADNYQVTVTDGNGCTYVDSTVVNQPTQLSGSIVATNVSCYGGTDGSIDLTVNGGIATYSYNWTNSAPANVDTTEDLNNIPAEYYSVLVTDQNGCTITLDQEITQPSTPLNVTYSVSDVLCFGDNTGAIDLTVTGGTPNYLYAWTSGQNTEDVNNLVAGTYGYTVTDANGCFETGTVVVTQPAQPLSVTYAIDDVNCFGGSDGSIDLTVSGGTSPYTYEWQNSNYLLSNTSQDLINYPADDYRYEVTDANGCKAIDTLTISEPPLLETSVVGVDILCKGGNNGSVDLTITGGVVPYAYLWNTGDVTEDLNTLYAGYYEVTVTDFNGCTATDNITLTEPADSLEFTYTYEDVRCNDGTDGSIDLSVTGGTVPYFYNWSSGDTLSQIEDLTAGWYTFLVTDNNGCTIGDSVFIDQPDALTANEVITPVTCNGLSDGTIDISPTGGTMPYSYTWYNSTYTLSVQTEDLVNFPADTYQLEIVDTNDCFYEMFFVLPEPDSLVIEYTYEIVSCAGGADANILVDISGGNPAYTTVWSNGATTEDLFNIPADIYQLTVTDTKGCTDSIEVEIVEPEPITMTFEHVPVSCEDQKDGIAYAYPTGGNGGYYYLWSNGETSSTNTDLASQYYYLEVTDVLGCTATDSVFITKNPVGCLNPVTAFTPNGDVYNDTWVIDNTELYPDLEIQIFNKWGNLVHQQKGLYEPWDGTINGEQAPSEVYYWIINPNYLDREILKGNITIVR